MHPQSTVQARIYALSDPLTPADIRYIGVTRRSLAARLNSHVQQARHGNPVGKRIYRYPVNDWARLLLEAGRLPSITELEVVPWAQEAEAECYWIERYRFVGASLLNVSMRHVNPLTHLHRRRAQGLPIT